MTTHITRLLHDWSTGDDEALNILMPLVHRELRQLARQHMRSERHGHTLQATALVSEAYLRLLTLKQIQWEDRDHFFAVAARLMRRILVDAARARDAEKRGFGTEPVPLDQAESKEDHSAGDLLFVDEALRKLQAFDARKAQVVELRVFMGLSVEETAAGTPRLRRNGQARLAVGQSVAQTRARTARVSVRPLDAGVTRRRITVGVAAAGPCR